MGTPGFAVGVLSKLVEEKVNVVGVITAPDRPAGRGRKLNTSAVKDYAVSQGLTVLQPTNLKNEDFLKELESLNANLQIVVAFRMLPKVVWQMPEYGTFNLHASLLPEYRGAAPINWAIINQEEKSGVTTFFIDEKIDTGAILLSAEIPIEERETAGTLHDKLMGLGSKLVLDTVQLIENNAVTTHIQKDAKDLKEAPKLHPENTRIDWSQPVEKIDALVRGLSPYPVAWTKIKNEEDIYKVKIYVSDFEVVNHDEAIGSIVTSKKTIKIAVENGYLIIKVLQFPGKRKMDAASFLNGFTFAKNAKAL
ncbi:methionyl-tRNA formyltransferase [Patiriisocius hiemis]|uniref:Methionyl-tRNA formyltransferase n=1 Tax=Patiriisocius hiemis TaxID=3075604 RepID=A0ABU2Y8P9_9FLAO|nr:methionyl-tRNA formyltransferase [Constantimarinum sp. W242]MDT0554538.1 methionyl-tRNA formyltransferase [Constantimarinum sp. W242]